ncbi:MAG: hypothetical protein ACLFQ5_09585 [Oceanicaulis sp.]
MRYLALSGLTVLAFLVAGGCVFVFWIGQYGCAMGAAYMPGRQSLIQGCDPFSAASLIGGGVGAFVSIAGVFAGWLVALLRPGWGFILYAASPGYAVAMAALSFVVAAPFQVFHDAQGLIP